MNTEIICWIIATIIVWEILYILIFKYFDYENWFSAKIYSFVGAMIFLFIQFLILTFEHNQLIDRTIQFHYLRLIWEAVIIVCLITFFYLNKKLSQII